ncbi:M48 family metalloprotease [Hyalangium rubrum]|uniref:M48 family metalloprotease n=1 Tax=Hyalangium rubrum TaxID=3103134 RepID=A0ABU5HHU9_9BACT|nr:M48 family metalloprotease [Hyalangium sp. s54d21]MDY7232816.1 M48 family metalloprotease [Hyalangium sp. s54d21]
MWALSTLALFTASLLGLARWLYTRIDSFVVRRQGARRLHFEEAPRLHTLVAHLSIAARIPSPRLYVVRRSQPNAFSLGMGPHSARIILTSAALDGLDEAELRAMVAHELAHIARGHTRRATLVATLAVLTRGALRSHEGRVWLHRMGTPPERDFAADRAAARLLGEARGLATLLTRLKERASGSAPFSDAEAGTPFTAPRLEGRSLDARIHRLQRMAAEEEARGTQASLRRSVHRRSRFYPRPGATRRPRSVVPSQAHARLAHP